VAVCPLTGPAESATPQQDEFVVVDTSTRADFLSKKSVATCVSTMQITPLVNRSHSMSMLTTDFNSNE
jgi:hypothetical protein